jgi:hypothetical protein
MFSERRTSDIRTIVSGLYTLGKKLNQIKSNNKNCFIK